MQTPRTKQTRYYNEEPHKKIKRKRRHDGTSKKSKTRRATPAKKQNARCNISTHTQTRQRKKIGNHKGSPACSAYNQLIKHEGPTPRTLSRFGPNLAARSVAHENSSKSSFVRDPSSSPPAPAPPASTVFVGRGWETSIPPTLPAVTALKPSGGGWVNGDWPIFTSTASPSSKDRDGKKPGSS